MSLSLVAPWRAAGLVAAVLGATAGPGFAQDRNGRAGPAGPQAPGPGRTLCVNEVPAPQSLLVRAGPSLSARITGRLAYDTCGILLVGPCDGDWCVMSHDGNRGWVNTRYIGVFEVPSATVAEPAAPGPPAPRALPRTATAAPSPAEAAKAPAPPPEPVAAKDEHQDKDRDEPPRRRRPHRKATAASHPKQPAARIAGFGRHGARPRPAVIEPANTGQLADANACVVRVQWWDTLRIRRGPGVGHDEVGGIPPNACRVALVGGCRGTWCRIAWRGQIGWVNTYYLR
jgi:SH3-like domain-containing protein